MYSDMHIYKLLRLTFQLVATQDFLIGSYCYQKPYICVSMAIITERITPPYISLCIL